MIFLVPKDFGNVKIQDVSPTVLFAMENFTAVTNQMKSVAQTGLVSLASSNVLTRWNV